MNSDAHGDRPMRQETIDGRSKILTITPTANNRQNPRSIPMTVEEIIEKLNTINAEVGIHRFTENYMQPTPWHVTITVENEETRLETKAHASVLSDALEDAWHKANAILQTVPGRKLLPPLLEAKVARANEEIT